MLVLILLLVAAAPAAEAQPPATEAPKLGVLMFMPMSEIARDDFRRGLREHGYVEGQNIVVDWRSANGSTDHANALAAELVRAKVSVIVAE